MTSDKLGSTELLFRCATRMGLQPIRLTPFAFAIATPQGERYIHAENSPLNPQLSGALAKNKHLTRTILAHNNIANIPFVRPTSHSQAAAFLAEHHKIIVKPLRGTGSMGVHIVTDAAQLATLPITGSILEKYIAGKEMRYLIVDGVVIGVHESRYGVSVQPDRALERISYAKPDWDPTLVALSLRVAGILGLRFACVDYLIDAHNHAHILEVNSSPGFKWFHAPTSGPIVDVATAFLEAMLRDQAAQSPTSNPSRLGLRQIPAYT